METNAYPLLGVIGPMVKPTFLAFTIGCYCLAIYFQIQTFAMLKGMRR